MIFYHPKFFMEKIHILRNWKKDNNEWGIFENSKDLPKFSPNINPEKVIWLRWEGKEELLGKYKWRYLDSKNSCIQFGKMQPDWNTVYSPEVIKPFIEYILKHAKLDDEWKGKVIIQLWPELAQSLSQRDGKEVLEFGQEKQKIEDIIRECIKECWEEWKNVEIEIQNVADNYPDVFDAIKNKWKDWIIPKEEPKLEDFELPLKSPLPIINYLAYHYSWNTDQNLKTLFYETKPAKYKEQDGEKHEPWTSDADYYSIVEVWIRLFEVLNWRFIQWWIDRQKVYDKIIYLILFWEDKISQKLKLEDYPKLWELHNRLIKYGDYENPKMMQLYIDLSKVEREIKTQKVKREEENRQKKEQEEKNKQKEKIWQERKKWKKSALARYLTILAVLWVLCWGPAAYKNVSNDKKNEISKVLKDDPKVLDLSDKDFTELDTIIQNTINSEPIDDYIDNNGPMVPGSLLELQRKWFEYDIDGKQYYCIFVIYRDKTFLFAKPKWGSAVYTLEDWKKVAEHMIKNWWEKK